MSWFTEEITELPSYIKCKSRESHSKRDYPTEKMKNIVDLARNFLNRVARTYSYLRELWDRSWGRLGTRMIEFDADSSAGRK